MKNQVICTIACCIGLAFASNAQTGSVEKNTFNGLTTIKVNTDEGEISLRVPPLSQRANVTGTVTHLQPKGKNKREKAENSAYLEGLVVDVEGAEKKQFIGKTLAFVVPATATAVYGVIKDRTGRTVKRFPIQVDQGYPSGPPSTGFSIPSVAQAGEPMFIPGPADGSLLNTSVFINGTEYIPVAECPEGIFVIPSSHQTGPVTVEINEGGHTTTGVTTIVGVGMTTGQTNLNTGQSTDLNVLVTGAESPSGPVTVQLQNENTATVHLAGGDTKCITVPTGQAVYTYQTSLEGQSTGAYSISATVLPDMSTYMLDSNAPEWNNAATLASYARILEEWAPRFAVCDPELANAMRAKARVYVSKAGSLKEPQASPTRPAIPQTPIKFDTDPEPAPIPAPATPSCNCDHIVATVIIENITRKEKLEVKLAEITAQINGSNSTQPNDDPELKKQQEILEKKIKDAVFDEKRTVDQDIATSIAKTGERVAVIIKVANVDSKTCDCNATKDCAFKLEGIKAIQNGQSEDFKLYKNELDESEQYRFYSFVIEENSPALKFSVSGQCVKPGCKDSARKEQTFQITFALN